MLRKIFLFLILALPLPLLASVGVDQMKFTHNLERGNIISGKITVINFSSEQAVFRLEQSDFLYSLDGGFKYPPVGENPLSNGKWITLSTPIVKIDAEKSLEVEYTITVPETLPKDGTYWSVIFVKESEPIKFDKDVQGEDGDIYKVGMIVEGKIAVQIIANVGTEGKRVVKVVNQGYDIEKKLIYFDLENTGDFRMELIPKATLYDTATGKTIFQKKMSNTWGINPTCSARYVIDVGDISLGNYLALLILKDQSGNLYSGQYNIKVESKKEDVEVSDEEIVDVEVSDEEIADVEVSDEEIADVEVSDEEIADEGVSDEEIVDEEVSDEEIVDEEVVKEEVVDKETVKDE